MAQNKLYRILSVAVMATVLTALLAVTAFAEITGGFGVILGLEDGKTYTAKTVTINEAGDGIAYVDADEDGEDDVIDLATENKDLAGLYEVTEGDNSVLVYVYGDFAERASLGNWTTSSSGDIKPVYEESKKTFKPGTWMAAKGSVWTDAAGWAEPAATGTSYLLGSTWVQSADLGFELFALTNTYETAKEKLTAANVTKVLTWYKTYYEYTSEEVDVLDPETGEPVIDLTTGTPFINEETGEPVVDEETGAPVIDPSTCQNKKETIYTFGDIKAEGIARADAIRNTTKNNFEGFSFKYAFEPEEIIPVGELEKFPFYVKTVQWYTFPAKAKAQAIFYVMDKNGEVGEYTWTSNYMSITDAPAVIINTVIDAQSILPDEGWVVGVDIKPFAIAEADSVKAITTGKTNSTIHATQYQYLFHWNKYVAAVSAPAGVTLEGRKYVNLQADEKYVFAPVNVNGIVKDEELAVSVTGVTEFAVPEDAYGLWGLFYDLEDDLDVRCVPVFTYGDFSKRANLYERDGAGKLILKNDSSAFNEGIISSMDSLYQSGTSGVQTESGFGAAFTKAFSHAADADARTDVLASYASSVRDYSFIYGFTADEIVPISEVKSLSYSVLMQLVYSHINFTYTNNVMRTDAYVMGTDGKIEVYTYLDTGKYMAVGTTTTSKVDFTKAAGWETPLPEEGYLVGIKTYPFYGMTNGEDAVASVKTDVTYNTNERLRLIYYVGSYVIGKPTAETPVVTFDGTVIKELKENVTYLVAPYSINGAEAGNLKTVTGKTEVDLAELYENPVGLYGICVAGSADTDPSDAVIGYVEGSYSARKAIHEIYNTASTTNVLKVASASTGNLGFVPGSITRYIKYSTSDNSQVYNKAVANIDIAGKAYGLLPETSFSWSLIKDFYEATTDAEKLTAFKKIQAVAQTEVYRYALTDEEIVPISEVQKYTFGVNGGANLYAISGFTYVDNTVRFEAYVMDKNGEISTYTYDFTGITHQHSSPNKLVVDFTDDDGWNEPLPEDGYFVGYVVYPYHGFTNPDNLTITIDAAMKYSDDKTRTFFYYYYGKDDYVIYRPTAETPDVELDGTVVTGLKADETYKVAPFVLTGIDANAAKDITAESNDLATLFENPVGLYAIYVPETTELGESDYALVFIQGTHEQNKKLGTYAEGNDYPTSYGDTTGVAPNLVTHPEWEIGYFRAPRMSHLNYSSTASKYMLGASPFTYIYDWIYDGSKTTAVYDAQENTEDPTALSTLQAGIEANLEKQNFRYAYTPEEIIPISDFVSMKFGVVSQNANHFSVDAKAKFALEVADENGNVTEYFWTSDTRTLDFFEDVYMVEASEIVGLPKEGYIVGFRFYPWGDIDAASIHATTRVPTGAYSFHFACNTRDYLLLDDVLVPVVEKFEPYRDWASATHPTNNFYITNYAEGLTYQYSYGTADAAGTEWFDATGDLIVARENSKYVWVKAILDDGREGKPHRSDKPAEAIAVEGIGLVLDGTIGVKVKLNYDPEVVERFHVYCNANIDSFDKTYYGTTTAEGAATVIIPFNAKDVNNVTYENNLVYKRKDETGTRNLEGVGAISVRSYVNAMKENAEEYAEWLPLIEALETYYNYADYYFDDEVTTVDEITLSAEEQLFVNEAVPTKEGEVDGIKHHSTSLILETSTTLRHYFKIDDINTIGNYTVTVNGVAAQFVAAESAGTNSYVYVDVANIPAEELDDVQVVSVNGVVVVNCSAVGYTNLAQNDSNAKLRNLAKAVAQYAYAANQMK